MRKTKGEQFAGLTVALITPFHHGEVDYDALRRLVEWHVEQGTDCLAPVGTTGESPTLTHAEHERIINKVVEFGARRAHSADSALQVARAAYLVGAVGTSLVLAGRRFGIPVFGTMAHSYIQAHDDEAAAFESFARIYPNTTLLVDTYDTLEGVRKVIDLSRRLGDRFRIRSIRLDSGDLAALARQARRMLDDAGLKNPFVREYVRHWAEHTGASRVEVISTADDARLIRESLDAGEIMPAGEGRYYARSYAKDTARSEERTIVATANPAASSPEWLMR